MAEGTVNTKTDKKKEGRKGKSKKDMQCASSSTNHAPSAEELFTTYPSADVTLKQGLLSSWPISSVYTQRSSFCVDQNSRRA